MADGEIMGLEEDGQLPVASVVNGASSSAPADDVLQARLDETTLVLRHLGQLDLAWLFDTLAELDLHDAMWVLDNYVRDADADADADFSGDRALFHVFRHSVRWHLFNLSQEPGYEDHDVSAVIAPLVLWVAQLTLLQLDDDTQSYRNGNGGFGAVPASVAAVRSLEKLTFRAAGGSDDGVTECSICLKEFVDGGQVTVMPCPSRVHIFHSDCISKWLAISNVCPLCRHELPACYE